MRRHRRRAPALGFHMFLAAWENTSHDLRGGCRA